jgi:hypothetical protein
VVEFGSPLPSARNPSDRVYLDRGGVIERIIRHNNSWTTMDGAEERTSDSLEELVQFWLTAQPSHLSPRSSKVDWEERRETPVCEDACETFGASLSCVSRRLSSPAVDSSKENVDSCEKKESGQNHR